MTTEEQTHAAPSPARSRRRANRAPMKMRPIAVLVSIALLCVLGVFLFDRFYNPAFDALRPDPGVETMSVPEFSLTTQDGESFTRADLLGHITVMDFFFSNCPAICPALTRSMKRIQDAVGERGVRLLSVSVDPVNDTPEALRRHASSVGADPRVWTFATGESFEQIAAISEGGLLLGLSKDPERRIPLPGGEDMEWIEHSGKLVVLNAEAQVIAIVSGLSEPEVDALIARLYRATAER